MSRLEAKRAAAQEAVKLIESGMLIGLGSGSTSEEMLRVLGQKVAAGSLSIQGVPTSEGVARQARQLGIPLFEGLPDFTQLDLTLDGADEVDPAGNLVKGGGGALLREKLVAAASRRLVIMVDEAKQVEQLCSTFALPVEIVPYGFSAILERLRRCGAEPALRGGAATPFLTDQGNYIADCRFAPLADPQQLQDQLISIPGVVETGLFLGMASCIVTGREDGSATSRSFLPAAPRYTRA